MGHGGGVPAWSFIAALIGLYKLAKAGRYWTLFKCVIFLASYPIAIAVAMNLPDKQTRAVLAIPLAFLAPFYIFSGMFIKEIAEKEIRRPKTMPREFFKPRRPTPDGKSESN